MLLADVQMLAPVRGTIFGREVVPDVWRMSATSCASAGPVRAAGFPASPQSRNAPAPPSGSGMSVMTATPSFCAACSAGNSLPTSTISALALRSLR